MAVFKLSPVREGIESDEVRLYILTNPFKIAYVEEKPLKKIRIKYEFCNLIRDNGDYDSLDALLEYIGKIPVLDKSQQLILGKEKNYFICKAREAGEELSSLSSKSTRKTSLDETINGSISEMMEPVNELLLCNLRFVVSVARKFGEKYGEEIYGGFKDRISCGIRGLFKGIIRYDHEGKGNVITYSKGWIDQAIQRGKGDLMGKKNDGNSCFIISLPCGLLGGIYKFDKWLDDYRVKNGKEPTQEMIEEAMEKIKLSKKSYEKGKNVLNIASLDKPLNINGNSTLGDGIEDPSNNGNFLDDVGLIEEKERLREYIKTLKPRERKILTLRNGYDNKKPYTLKEVGEVFDITREGVRQIETRALEKLRKKFNLRELGIY